jgi:hypothetical protein
MSSCRQQALIEGSVEQVWELLGDPRRHPEWWPRVMEVKGERFVQEATYRQITKVPTGQLSETTLMVERLDDLRAIRTRCLDTGMYADWRLTGAQDGTFLDAELGMDPQGMVNRLFDMTAGRPYFRRWLRESVESLKRAAEGGRPG